MRFPISRFVIKKLFRLHKKANCCCKSLGAYTVQCRDKRPKICVRHACAQFAYTCLGLSVHAFPMHLISIYELAYCLFRVLILLLVLVAVDCKSMA